MDLSFLENVQDEVPPADVAQAEEESKLVAVAKYIPLLEWVYDPNKGGPDDGGATHLGFVTQALKKVPGLASAVSVDPNTGTEQFDARMVAAAALSLVAALARKVYNIRLDEDYANENIGQ